MEEKEGATPAPALEEQPNEAITPPGEDVSAPEEGAENPLDIMPVVQLDSTEVTPEAGIDTVPTVDARTSMPPAEHADRTSVTCEITGTTSDSPDPACRAVDLEDPDPAAPPAQQVERVEVVKWESGDVQPKLTLEPAAEVPTQVTGLKLTLMAPAKGSMMSAPSEVRVTVLDESGNAAAFEVPTPALSTSAGRPQTFVVKFDSAGVSPQIAEGKISRVSIGGATARSEQAASSTGAVVVSSEFLTAPAAVPAPPSMGPTGPVAPPPAPPTGLPGVRPPSQVPAVPVVPPAPSDAPGRSPSTAAPRVPAQQDSAPTRIPSLPGTPSWVPDTLPGPAPAGDPGASQDPAGPATGSGQDAATGESAGESDAAAGGAEEPRPAASPTQEQRLDALPFGPAALPPDLVTLLQTTGIALAILGSMALIAAEERRRRRMS